MPQTGTIARNLALAAALAAIAFPVSGADETIQVEVLHALATPDGWYGPNVANYRMKFDLRLVNQ